MNNGIAAQIRKPTNDELRQIRDLWDALKQQPLPVSTEIGIELQTYLAHAVRMIGIIAALHPVTGERVIPGEFPLRVTEDGVARLHDSVRLCKAILSLWTGSGITA